MDGKGDGSIPSYGEVISDEKRKVSEGSDDVEIEMDDKSMEKAPLDSSNSTEPIDEQNKGNCFTQMLLKGVNEATTFVKMNKTILRHVFFGLLLAGYCAYFIGAMVYGFQQAIPLIVLTVVVLVIVILEVCSKRISGLLKNTCNLKACTKSEKVKKVLFWLQVVCVCAFFIWLLVSIIIQSPRQLVSLLGLCLIIFVCFIFSKYPNDVSWRPVLWGIIMQFILGLIVLRTKVGFNAVKFIGDQVATFMRYSDYGSKFVFGDAYFVHMFAFKILPMIVFFSTVMNMLYYIGIMQWFIGKLSWVTQKTLGTSAIESTVSVANIFVGMTEAPLVVRPYLNDLTRAEIHSVLTCGLGSIAFSVFGAFVEMGIDSVHLLTACVMSAPASLAISRLLFPERQKSKFITTHSLKLTEGSDRNIVEAAAVGASMSIGLVANIAANLIAFLALLAFINSSLNWFGAFVGYPDFTFQVLCGYLFMPLAFLMGADWEDCGTVGELFGVKTFLNEFIAYKNMKPLVENRLLGNVSKFNNGTAMFMSERSEVVAIHALCGFCNISSLGIIIGGLGSLMPEKKGDLAELAMRAFMGGIFTCCMTASIASLLFVETISAPTTGNNTLGMNNTGF
ncbi:solute carrier family 28 member 3-like [Styela clava]